MEYINDARSHERPKKSNVRKAEGMQFISQIITYSYCRNSRTLLGHICVRSVHFEALWFSGKVATYRRDV